MLFDMNRMEADSCGGWTVHAFAEVVQTAGDFHGGVGEARAPVAQRVGHNPARLDIRQHMLSDAVIDFNPLSNEKVAKIADSMLNQIKERLGEQGIEIVLIPEAVAWICAQERDASLGARPMHRTIERAIENPLATMVVRGEDESGKRVVVGVKANGSDFTTSSEEKA